MPFKIIRNDITKVKADAIVNTANPKPVVGGGTDSAIYRAAGEERLLEERRKIGNIALGQSVHTAAFHLDAKYIIHTVGPAWIDGNHKERDILHSCYRNSLNLAAQLECESIAFPLIATGVYGFPKDEALQIALEEINRFLLSNEMNVILVVFDRKAFELSARLVDDIKEYISEHSVREIREAEYDGMARNESRRRREAYPESENIREEENQRAIAGNRKREREPEKEPESGADINLAWKLNSEVSLPAADMAGKNLDEILDHTGSTFQEKLLQLIDESGMGDVEVYKKANIDRKVFSRIRCKKDYRPKKKTAVAFAIALQLDMPTMLDLLSRAEIAFSPSNKFDLIITYFVTNRVYDIYEINAALFKYGQPILGE